MPKYLITVREDVYHTYVIESDEDRDAVEDVFYELNAEELKNKLISTECYKWEIDNVEIKE